MDETVIRWESSPEKDASGVYLIGFEDGVTKYGMTTSSIGTRVQDNRRKKGKTYSNTGSSLETDIIGVWIHETQKPRAAEIALHRCFVDVPRVGSKSSEWLDMHVNKAIEISSGLEYWPKPIETLLEIEARQEEIRSVLGVLGGLGDVLRAIRHEVGLKQSELAEEMDMRTGVLSRLESQNPLIEFEKAMSIIRKYRSELPVEEKELSRLDETE